MRFDCATGRAPRFCKYVGNVDAARPRSRESAFLLTVMSSERRQTGNSSAVPHPTVSLCIPTHGRPRFLLEALESGASQTRLPDEILVSDDLGSNETQEVVSAFARRQPLPVRYVRCTLGQSLAHNINNCLREAACDLVLLLHDDDLLAPRAIEALLRPFLENAEIIGAYGKQMLITEGGDERTRDSERLNRDYDRSAAAAGVQRDAVVSGIRQQFPNDGYLVKTSVARQVLQKNEYGAACEVDFGIRMGERGPFYFVDQYTAKYRLSAESITRGNSTRRNDSGYHAVRIYLHLLETHPSYREETVARLREVAPIGIGIAINLGRLKEAIVWYFGPYHRRLIATPGGIRRGVRIMWALLKYWFSTER